MKISFAKNHRKVLAPLIAASILTASLTLTMTSTCIWRSPAAAGAVVNGSGAVTAAAV